MTNKQTQEVILKRLTSIDATNEIMLKCLCEIDEKLRDITTLLTVIAARSPQMPERQQQQ